MPEGDTDDLTQVRCLTGRKKAVPTASFARVLVEAFWLPGPSGCSEKRVTKAHMMGKMNLVNKRTRFPWKMGLRQRPVLRIREAGREFKECKILELKRGMTPPPESSRLPLDCAKKPPFQSKPLPRSSISAHPRRQTQLSIAS